MKKKIADKWVKALRSGKFKQTQGQLQDAEGFCCLGVLCILAEQEGVDVARKTYKHGPHLKGGVLEYQKAVMEWADLSSDDGFFELSGISSSLVDKNDSGESFEEIADFIEKHYEIL